MSILTTCPSCGRKFGLPPGFSGGAVKCPDPACAQGFSVPSPAASAPRIATANGRAQSATGRPELLDRLPTSLLGSPAMIPVGAIVAVLYGMVLFAVVSSNKNEPEPEPEPMPPPRIALAPAAPVPKTPEPVNVARTKEGPKADNKGAAKPEPARLKEKPPEPDSIAKAEPKEKGPDTSKRKAKPKAPAAPPEPPPNMNTEFWGVLSGIPGTTKFLPDAAGLTIALPGKLYILSPELKTKSAPMLLTEVTGDFTALVKIPGKILPGTAPLKGLPFTFQGAGLIVWQDENNYLRLERASLFTADRVRVHHVLVEVCKEGKTIPSTFKEVRDTDIILRLDRHGSELRCQYSTDGKAWFDAKRQSVAFPAAVGVGVSAANASPKPFAARFEDFELTGPTPKP
jgi:regulation of enolase protein 1 (concanavalin A-like superfamily)